MFSLKSKQIPVFWEWPAHRVSVTECCVKRVSLQQLNLNIGNDSERTVWQNEIYASERIEETHKTFCEQNRLYRIRYSVLQSAVYLSIQFVFGVKVHERMSQFFKIVSLHFSGSFSANGSTYRYFYHAFSSLCSQPCACHFLHERSQDSPHFTRLCNYVSMEHSHVNNYISQQYLFSSLYLT